ncbi:GTP cyclohydrolase I [Emericellopsis atlantica]|uniref:GTP cyclohydrolase 1 n=1 Tax=Emericellopsis atlantica TaxID=2614577 RepID=A0A9P8CML2_9HYPO|nr:GTP cyclohydrolase I [Emericellopsis atlantica]KAG9250801.1 GTP cyclohydrolase I [Emericellopsis atlantica]
MACPLTRELDVAGLSTTCNAIEDSTLASAPAGSQNRLGERAGSLEDISSSMAANTNGEVQRLGNYIPQAEEPVSGGTRLEKMSRAVKTLIECLGEDPSREGLRKTPQRYAEALLSCTRGYHVDPHGIMNNALLMEEYSGMVVVRDIQVYSLCEHHLLPFTGKIHIGYVSSGVVIGLSKLARIAELFFRRLQVQGRLTKQIADAIMDIVKPQGVAVVIAASHLCMAMRGVQETNAMTVTSSFMGCFEQDVSIRNEFRSSVGL